jgi:hypothetical protein
MRVLVAASMLVLLVGSALAHDDHVQRYGEKDKDKTQEQIQAEKDAERAYKKSLGNIPDKSPTDPWGWGTVRGTDEAAKTAAKPDTAAKPAKPKTKTGAANN